MAELNRYCGSCPVCRTWQDFCNLNFYNIIYFFLTLINHQVAARIGKNQPQQVDLDSKLADIFTHASRQGFNRQNKTNGNANNPGQQKAPTPQNSSPTTYTPPAPPPTTSTSSVLTPGSSQENPSNLDNQQQQIQQMQPQVEPEPVKFFFREKYARLGVKGNFMPLAAQPKNVDLAEWLAHQGTTPSIRPRHRITS